MWWCYLLCFMGGSLVGLVLMALMAASREPEPHEVHVYCDEHGNLEILTISDRDKIIWHNKPEDTEVE